MKKVALILSGCGVYDGAEIHEAVLTLLALARAGASVSCVAPNIDQKEVINHVTGSNDDEDYRNVMEEAARISRGSITQLSQLELTNVDALIFAGGFGVAKTLSSLAYDGATYDIDPIVRQVIEKAQTMGRPLGFMCIAPALAAAALCHLGVALTIGNDPDYAAILESKGARHHNCAVDDVVVDVPHKIVSTPAYMLAQTILEAEMGINKLVQEVLKLT